MTAISIRFFWNQSIAYHFRINSIDLTRNHQSMDRFFSLSLVDPQKHALIDDFHDGFLLKFFSGWNQTKPNHITCCLCASITRFWCGVCVYLIFYFVNHAVRCFLLLDSGCCSCILVVNENDSVERWMGLVACVAYGSAHITKYLLTFCPSNFFHYAIPLQCRFQVVYFFLFIFLMIFFWCVDKFQYGFSWTRAQFKRLLAALSSVTVYFRKQQA